MTPDRFVHWLHWGKGPCVYYYGYLGMLHPENRPPIADIARECAEQGRIYLTQRRHGEHRYEYIATKWRPE